MLHAVARLAAGRVPMLLMPVLLDRGTMFTDSRCGGASRWARGMVDLHAQAAA